MVICQEQIIKECKSAIKQLQDHTTRDMMKVTGVKESDEEDSIRVVQSFFKNNMKIGQDIPIEDAYRVGKRKNRPILFQLSN